MRSVKALLNYGKLLFRKDKTNSLTVMNMDDLIVEFRVQDTVKQTKISDFFQRSLVFQDKRFYSQSKERYSNCSKICTQVL